MLKRKFILPLMAVLLITVALFTFAMPVAPLAADVGITSESTAINALGTTALALDNELSIIVTSAAPARAVASTAFSWIALSAILVTLAVVYLRGLTNKARLLIAYSPRETNNSTKSAGTGGGPRDCIMTAAA